MHRRRQVENRRDAQLTPAVEAEGVQGVPCARFPPRTRHAPLVFVDASIVFVDDGSVESHLNRRYLISATPHWTIDLSRSLLRGRRKFLDGDPHLYGYPLYDFNK